MKEQETHTELLQSQTNVEEQDSSKSSSQIIERRGVKGTPFQLVKTEEGWFLTLGRFRVTEMHETAGELEVKVSERDWTLLLTVATIVGQESERLTRILKEQEELQHKQ